MTITWRETEPLRAVRGTILAVDHECLREGSLFERYTAALSPANGMRERVLSSTASEWLEVALLMEHYRALDTLRLSDDEAFEFGKRVGERVHGALLRVLVKLASTLGAGPWRALAQAEKLWARSWDGGAMYVARESERVARFTVQATPPSASPFFRASFCGAVHAGVTLLCASAVVAEAVPRRTEASFEATVRWK